MFFFSSRRRHTRWPRDWSSDVCSSDLNRLGRTLGKTALGRIGRAFHVKNHRIFGNLLLDGFHNIHKTAVTSLMVSMIFGGRGRPFPVSRSLPSNPVAHSSIGILPQHAGGNQMMERTESALPRA